MKLIPLNFITHGEQTPLRRMMLEHVLAGGGALNEYEIEGNPVSFVTNLARPLSGFTIPFLPVQDLHGQSAPYPPGGGKNKYNAETKTTGQALNTGNGGTYNNANWEVSDFIPASNGDITLAWDSESNYYQANFCAYDANKNFIAESGVAFSGYGYAHTFTAPAETAFVRFSWAFVVSGTEYPRTNVRACIGASDLGFAPYSNICPISGWTGLTAWRTGKNLIAPVLYKGVSYNPTVGTVFNTELHTQQFTDNHDGTFTLTASSSWQYYCLLFPVHHKKRCYVTIQCSSTGNLGRTVGYLDKDLKVLTASNLTTTSWTYSVYLNPEGTDDAEYWYMVISNRSSASATITVTNPQIEYSSSESEYEPYTGQSYPVTFPATGKNLLNPALLKDQSGWNTFGIKVKPNTQYTASTTKPKNNGLAVYFNDSAMDGGSSAHGLSNEQAVTITSTADGFVYISQRKASGDASFADFDFQIEEGQTATAYEPFTNTIYGGYVDWVNGVAVVEWAKVTFDGSQANNQFGFENVSSVTEPRNRISWVGIYAEGGGVVGGKYISDKLIGDSSYIQNPSIWHVSNSGANVARMFIGVPTNITSVVDWQSYVTQNPISVAYKLATPIEIPLSDITVPVTLIGDNTIWTDTNGENTIKYLKKG